MLRSRESEILERSESGVGNFGKVGVGNFTSDSTTLIYRVNTFSKSAFWHTFLNVLQLDHLIFSSSQSVNNKCEIIFEIIQDAEICSKKIYSHPCRNYPDFAKSHFKTKHI